MSAPLPVRTGEPAPSRLLDNLVLFCRALSAAGLPVGPGAMIRATEAVLAVGLDRRADVFWALHGSLVTRRDQTDVFTAVFDAFWQARGGAERLIELMSPVAAPRPDMQKPDAAQRRADAALAPNRPKRPEPETERLELDAQLTASDREQLAGRDFEQMTADELARASRAVAGLVAQIPPEATRRFAPAPRGLRPDIRRTLRSAAATGSFPSVLARTAPRTRTPPIVALVDISGSMATYARVFLHFLHALSAATRPVHVFTFGTRLTNISRALKEKDPDAALAAVSAQVADWSGGTRIATALCRFNRDWSRRVLAGRPIVLLATDGLERDSGDDLAFEADRLHRSCRRLIWLNPLLRFSGFEPRARGVRMLLPHVDEFRPVHSLNAVSDLCRALAAPGAPGAADPRRWAGSAEKRRRD